MGVVYLGHDDLIDRKLALKELTVPPGIRTYEREELVERFYREARAAGGLSHHNIVTIHDVFEEDGRYFIAMEFINGSKLSDVLRSGPMSVDFAREVMVQCLNALSFAHTNGVIHRDLKPDNIFLTPDKRIKITDFGIASVMGARRITTEGMVLGTPGYMSPEQVRGLKVDSTTDIFSLGIVFYELLTGSNPFDAESSTSIMDRIVNEDPTPVTQLNSTVPETVDRIIEKSLQKIPANRFKTAEEFKEHIITDRAPVIGAGIQYVDGTTVGVIKTPPVQYSSSECTNCPSCGEIVMEQWVRCPYCATDLKAPIDASRFPGAAVSAPMLTVIDGSSAGAMFAIGKNVVYLGRGLDNDIHIEDSLISRRHARIFRATDGNYYVEDAGSSNGTFVNGEEITTARIRSGDYIEIGETTLVFISG